ncbi:MAG: hypothetical protein ACE5OP_03130 [Candidatus Glassbacteria bacterium]
MRNILIFSCIMGLALIGCSNNSPVANEGNDDAVFPYPGSSSNPITESLAVENSHLMAVNSSELPEPPAGLTNTWLCLWTSTTYYESGSWNWQDVDLKFTVGSDGTLAIEFITELCNPTGTDLATAYAVYFASAKKPLDFGLFCDITAQSWGCLPTLPTDWCWILMVDCSWTVPHDHGISLTLDWASAYNKGATVPPIGGVCGWPLAGNPPPTFTVNGI